MELTDILEQKIALFLQDWRFAHEGNVKCHNSDVLENQ